MFVLISQIIHVWYIYLHLPHKWPSFVGKYTIHGSSGILKQSCYIHSRSRSNTCLWLGWLGPGTRGLGEKNCLQNLTWLVVWKPLKHMKVSWDDEIPNICKKMLHAPLPCFKYINLQPDRKRWGDLMDQFHHADQAAPMWLVRQVIHLDIRPSPWSIAGWLRFAQWWFWKPYIIMGRNMAKSKMIMVNYCKIHLDKSNLTPYSLIMPERSNV